MRKPLLMRLMGEYARTLVASGRGDAIPRVPQLRYCVMLANKGQEVPPEDRRAHDAAVILGKSMLARAEKAGKVAVKNSHVYPADRVEWTADQWVGEDAEETMQP